MNSTELINPRGDAETAERLCDWIHQRKMEIIGDFSKVEVTEQNWNSKDLKDEVKRLSDVVEDLRDKGKQLVAHVLAETEAQRVVTQIDPRLWTYSTKSDPLCVYAQLSARLKELKDAIQAQKDAHTPPAPRHTYVIQAELTDADLKAVLKAMDKVGASYRYAAPQSDKAAKAVAKFFDENL